MMEMFIFREYITHFQMHEPALITISQNHQQKKITGLKRRLGDLADSSGPL